MGRINCWEFMRCGREVGGSKATTLGICPAATFTEANNYLGGKNGGRSCFYVTGTFCSDAIQGTRKEKQKDCDACEFYQTVREEHSFEMSIASFLHYIRNSRMPT